MAFVYSAFYRFCILFIKPSSLHKKWGKQGEESPAEETIANYRYARVVSRVVNHVCNNTTWESKCLVRALTAQRLLYRKGIHSTLYLGCGTNDGKMVAHAWLRCGRMYVTGGDGSEYAIVDKYFM